MKACDTCGSNSCDVLSSIAKEFRVGDEKISMLYGLFICDNGHFFRESYQITMKKERMTGPQLVEFLNLPESKRHGSGCGLCNCVAFHPFYEGHCTVCDYKEKTNESV